MFSFSVFAASRRVSGNSWTAGRICGESVSPGGAGMASLIETAEIHPRPQAPGGWVREKSLGTRMAEIRFLAMRSPRFWVSGYCTKWRIQGSFDLRFLKARLHMRFLMRFRVPNALYPTLHECFFREASRGLGRKLWHYLKTPFFPIPANLTVFRRSVTRLKTPLRPVYTCDFDAILMRFCEQNLPQAPRTSF